MIFPFHRRAGLTYCWPVTLAFCAWVHVRWPARLHAESGAISDLPHIRLDDPAQALFGPVSFVPLRRIGCGLSGGRGRPVMRRTRAGDSLDRVNGPVDRAAFDVREGRRSVRPGRAGSFCHPREWVLPLLPACGRISELSSSYVWEGHPEWRRREGSTLPCDRNSRGRGAMCVLSGCRRASFRV